MATDERIGYIRNFRSMMQKYLDMVIGFDKKAADVRMAPYEFGTRTPKKKMPVDIFNLVAVRPQPLTVPNIESYISLAHTLFVFKDFYGRKMSSIKDGSCLTLDKDNRTMHHMFNMFSAWQEKAERLKGGEIAEAEYNA